MAPGESGISHLISHLRVGVAYFVTEVIMPESSSDRPIVTERLLPLAFVLTALVGSRCLAQSQPGDWTQFGWDVAASSAPTEPTGITSANVASLQRRQVMLDGTVDSSAVYLHAVKVKGSEHDVFFVTTTYGKTIAIDANQGSVLWEYTPPKLASWEGSRQITNTTPVADPDRHHIYAAVPDGTIQKLAISDGHVLWSTAITLLPLREKMASPLREFRGHIVAVTAGYIGDKPPYQGHVAILDAQTGKVLHIWNSLCSNRAELLDPSSCPSAQSAIWSRAGAVIDAATGNIFLATGNGPYNGKTDWGDSIIELDADATRMLGNYTPTNNAELNDRDLDLGSTSPVLLPDGLLAQGGKDRLIRLVSIQAMSGTVAHQGQETQTLSTPSGDRLFTAPAVWRHDGETWMFAADGGGTVAWTLKGGKLQEMWKNANGGTSPVIAGGLLYIYNPKGGLRIYEPRQGTQVANLDSGSGHWNSPIVVNGKIALPEGNANQHASSGVLDIWGLPASAP
jgi:outer membrane protein assembly factor BamB